MPATKPQIPMSKAPDFMTPKQVARVLGYGVDRFGKADLDALGIPYVDRGTIGGIRVAKAALAAWARGEA